MFTSLILLFWWELGYMQTNYIVFNILQYVEQIAEFTVTELTDQHNYYHLSYEELVSPPVFPRTTV